MSFESLSVVIDSHARDLRRWQVFFIGDETKASDSVGEGNSDRASVNIFRQKVAEGDWNLENRFDLNINYLIDVCTGSDLMKT